MNSKLRILPAFRYSIKGYLKASIIFGGIMVIVYIFLNILLGLAIDGGSANIASFEISSFIFMFILGITSIREDLRMFIQHGIGRKTSFITSVLCALSIGLLLSVFGELLMATSAAIFYNNNEIIVQSFYQSIMGIEIMTFGQHLFSILVNFSIGLTAYFSGMFCSLIFYRLSKFGKLLVAIGVPAFFIILLPLIARTGPGSIFMQGIGKLFVNMANLIAVSNWYLILFALIITLVFAVFCRLLVRRAPIQAANS